MLTQLRRDVVHLANRLSGRRTSPIVKARGTAPVTKERELRVARVVRETHDVTTLVFRDRHEGERHPFDFLPGQFFTVTIDGIARNYSASNVPGGDELHLTIKLKATGALSPLLSSLEAGADVSVAGPYGSFTVTPDPAKTRRIVLIAGGVGITPLVSIAKTILATEANSQVALVFGNRSPADIAFGADLEALAQACPDRFVLRHVLESDGRRLDRATAARMVAELPRAFAIAEVYLCGPDAMMTEVLAALPHRKTKTERFVVGPRNPTMPPPRDIVGSRTVAIQVNGRELRALALAGATLLDAGLSIGALMPFSCCVGGCGACRVRLVEGHVEMEEPNCLTKAEREAGYVLACVGRPGAGGCTIRIEGDS